MSARKQVGEMHSALWYRVDAALKQSSEETLMENALIFPDRIALLRCLVRAGHCNPETICRLCRSMQKRSTIFSLMIHCPDADKSLGIALSLDQRWFLQANSIVFY